jgi:hypothetical protein
MKLIPLLLIGTALFLTTTAFVRGSADRVREVKNLKTGASTFYTYTSDGHIATVKNSNGNISTYQYMRDVIYRKTSDPKTKTYTIDTFFLDNRGLATVLHSGGHLSTINSSQLFEYDSNGFQTGWKTMDRGVIRNVFKSTYADSNEIRVRQNFPGDKRVGMFYSYYDTTRVNTLGNENLGTAFLGRSSKNLIKEYVQIWGKGDTALTHYDYRFDDKGRMSIKVESDKTGPGDSIAYFYQPAVRLSLVK